MVLALRDAGYEPIVFDNLSRGHADAVGGMPLVIGDLRRETDIEACFRSQRIDLVMHFAALAYVGESVLEPELYYQNNVIGTLNLLAAMRRHRVNRIVFSSTCATYGEPHRLPIDESHIRHPINPYGHSKLMIEQALADYAVAYGLNSISLRYFNAAGCDPAARAGERHFPETHLIPLVLAEAMRVRAGGNAADTQLKVFGTDFPTADGSCVRDYIHVADLCSAHLAATERLLLSSSIGAEAYNLANGVGFSVIQVIQACRRVTGQDIRYQAVDRRPGDPAELVGDAAAALAVLGWRPRYVLLDDIIRTAWSWMDSRAENALA
jgi:UDP-glucose-4-epimerase GalE